MYRFELINEEYIDQLIQWKYEEEYACYDIEDRISSISKLFEESEYDFFEIRYSSELFEDIDKDGAVLLRREFCCKGRNNQDRLISPEGRSYLGSKVLIIFVEEV